MKSAMRKTQTAPRIQSQAKGKLLICSFRIDKETLDELQAYAEFIYSDRSHVIREALKFLFRKWRQWKVPWALVAVVGGKSRSPCPRAHRHGRIMAPLSTAAPRSPSLQSFLIS